MTDTTDCYPCVIESDIVNLYNTSDLEEITESAPFTTQVILYGPGGKTSCFQANVDDEAIVNVIDLQTIRKAEHNLKKLTRSNQSLHMANGLIVLSH
jgi:hypothetical protein